MINDNRLKNINHRDLLLILADSKQEHLTRKCNFVTIKIKETAYLDLGNEKQNDATFSIG